MMPDPRLLNMEVMFFHFLSSILSEDFDELLNIILLYMKERIVKYLKN
jgi:hypothetical protein